ncbi:MAG: DUF6263 family protein, partial [Planctomycetota bacterium]|nr:DUF6263 family protein [Planctomycetota bacterium]
YKRVILNTKGVRGDRKIDSEDKTVNRKDPQVKVLTALVDNPFKMTVSSSGKVTKVVGINKIAEAVIKDLGGPGLNAQVAQHIRLQLSNKNMQQQMDGLLSILPEKSTSVGQKWTRGPVKTDHPLGFVVKTDKISLKGIENKNGRDVAVIETNQDTKITITKKETPTLKVYDIDTEFKDSKGLIQFDVTGGFLNKLVHNVTTDMKFTGKKQKGIDIRSVVKLKTTILLMPAEESKNKE